MSQNMNSQRRRKDLSKVQCIIHPCLPRHRVLSQMKFPFIGKRPSTTTEKENRQAAANFSARKIDLQQGEHDDDRRKECLIYVLHFEKLLELTVREERREKWSNISYLITQIVPNLDIKGRRSSEKNKKTKCEKIKFQELFWLIIPPEEVDRPWKLAFKLVSKIFQQNIDFNHRRVLMWATHWAVLIRQSCRVSMFYVKLPRTRIIVFRLEIVIRARLSLNLHALSPHRKHKFFQLFFSSVIKHGSRSPHLFQHWRWLFTLTIKKISNSSSRRRRSSQFTLFRMDLTTLRVQQLHRCCSFVRRCSHK